jgi:multiple sugar transport system ATP-binding protein
VPNGPWSGEVLHVEDLGSDHFLFVEIGSDDPVIVRRPGKANIEVGAKVSLAPQAGHLYRFDANGKPIR